MKKSIKNSTRGTLKKMLQCNIFYDFTPAKMADISKICTMLRNFSTHTIVET